MIDSQLQSYKRAPKSSTFAVATLAERGCTAYPVAWVRAGPPAAAIREPRQARKGAAAAVMPGAGVWLARILQQAKQDKSNELPRTCKEVAAEDVL